MRYLLGNCVIRAFLVVGPARSSRSHGAWAACGGRRQKKKRVVIVFIVLSNSSPRRDGFVLPSAASCRWAATTHAMAAKVILSLMVSLSVLVDARVPRPSCVPEQQTRTYSVVIRHSPQSTTHLSLYNASEVSCKRVFNHFYLLSTSGKKTAKKKNRSFFFVICGIKEEHFPTKQAPKQAAIRINSDIWDQIPPKPPQRLIQSPNNNN